MRSCEVATVASATTGYPPKQKWDSAVGKWRNDDLGRIRARAAVAMTGRMAESIFEDRRFPTTTLAAARLL
jgi:hypothetical protein